MENLESLVVFKNDNGLSIKDFEDVKRQITSLISLNYICFEVQNKEDLKRAKEIRTELNKIAKGVNDNKIAWVKDMTELVQSQTKEIVEIVKNKSNEFDTNIKLYEESMGGEKKTKAHFKVEIEFESKEEMEKFTSKLPKKLKWKAKEL